MAVDPQLGTIETPNGRIDFLRLVGVTSDELAKMKAMTTEAVLSRIGTANPLLVIGASR